jgi:hypothetical protein
MLTRHAARLVLAAACTLAPAAERAQAASAPVFQLQNNFWVNLHEFLRGEARRVASRAMPRMGTGIFADAERITWSKALTMYADVAPRDPASEAALVSIANALARVPDAQAVPWRTVEPLYAEALMSAAPIYRRYLWLRHRDRNDTYLTVLRDALQRRGPKLAGEIASQHHVTWPVQPIIVDIVSEAGPQGAYATTGPSGTAAHIIVAAEQRAGGDAMLDLLFTHAVNYLERQ